MYKGTTPTYVLTFPEDINLENTNVYVSFSKPDYTEVLRKTNAYIEIATNVVSVFLTQEETLAMPPTILMQVNWTYIENGVTKRACSNIVTVDNRKNLINEVL